MQIGILGSGSWATALAKLLTGNQHVIHWAVRNQTTLDYLAQHRHNPQYLSAVIFDPAKIRLDTDVARVVRESDCIIIAIPSAYVIETLSGLDAAAFQGKKVVSAVKGILPQDNLLLNDYLHIRFGLPLTDYFTIMGPCHAEEIAAEKLSYLTFSGVDEAATAAIANLFACHYLNTVINQDVYGVQYAAVLKNIYALGAGMAHGLEYGDNFLSVFIANCADEMAGFLKAAGIQHIEVGVHEGSGARERKLSPNYAASVYLGDLLVTCYSLYSRNRTFGNMIGKGYSVKVTQLELNMVAEGYMASKCIYQINQKTGASLTIAETIYRVLWENLNPAKGFAQIEEILF